MNVLRKMSFLCLLIFSCTGYTLVGSEEGKKGDLELANVNNSNVVLGADGGINGDTPYRVPSPVVSAGNSKFAGYRNLIDGSQYSDDCKSKCCCGSITFVVLAGLGFGLGFGLGNNYEVYNRDNRLVDIHYRPGCSKTTRNSKGDKRTRTVDCVRTVWPDHHTNIYSVGDLTKLCAEYTTGGYSTKCATQNGIRDYRTWYVDNLSFKRGTGPQGPLSTNSSASAQSLEVTFTDAEMKEMAKSAVVVEKSVKDYLYGPSKLPIASSAQQFSGQESLGAVADRTSEYKKYMEEGSAERSVDRKLRRAN